MKILPFIVTTSLYLISFSAVSGEMLTGEQIKELFTNKTYDIEKMDVSKNNHLSAYVSSDGKRVVYIPWKDKLSNRKWWIEGNSICASHPKREDYCRGIMSVGNGVYHSLDNGKHLSTISNLRDGNQL